MRVPYLDLSVRNREEKEAILRAVEVVLSHGRLVLGPEVDELESEVAKACGVRYAVGVSSGTEALYLALRSLDIGGGDEVITSCLSFVATANAIALTGANPVFVDIGRDFNMDPEKVAGAFSTRTKAIVPVHFAGKVCNMDRIMQIAEARGIVVVEDAAQSFGATYRGKKAGSLGRVSALSMNAMKVLAACGDAGMVVTSDADIRDRLLALRYNGMVDKIRCKYRSLNGRLDTMQAAILLVRLRCLEEFIHRRREIARLYNDRLHGHVEVPEETEGCRDVYYTYNVKSERRDELQAFLGARGIETKVNYPLLMPQQPAYGEWKGSGFPLGEELVRTSLSLPLHPGMKDEEVEYVIEQVLMFCRLRSPLPDAVEAGCFTEVTGSRDGLLP